MIISLTLYQTINLDNSKFKELADNNFKCDKNGRKISKLAENTMGKRRNCSLLANSPLPSFFQNTCTADT